jgi:hypothetical protein
MIAAARASADWFPLDRRFRTTPANLVSNIAVHINSRDWQIVAIGEVRAALRDDPTSADLIGKLIGFEMAIGEIEDAKADFGRFKLIARKSKLIPIIEQTLQERAL